MNAPLIKSFSFSVHPSIQTLMQEIKKAATEKYEVEIRDVSILMAIFGAFIQIFDAKIKKGFCNQIVVYFSQNFLRSFNDRNQSCRYREF